MHRYIKRNNGSIIRSMIPVHYTVSSGSYHVNDPKSIWEFIKLLFNF